MASVILVTEDNRNISIPDEDTVILGRGELLGIQDKRISIKQLEISKGTNGQFTITGLGNNSSYLTNKKGKSIAMKKGKLYPIKAGDSFHLLQDEFGYTFKIEEKDQQNDSEVEEEEISLGKPIRTCYAEFKKSGVLYKVGDFVMVEPEDEDEPKWIAQLSSIYKTNDGKACGTMKWLWRPGDVPSLKKLTQNSKELLITGERDENPLDSVFSKCVVKHKSDLKIEKENHYFCARSYDARSKVLKRVTKSEFLDWTEDGPGSLGRTLGILQTKKPKEDSEEEIGIEKDDPKTGKKKK